MQTNLPTLRIWHWLNAIAVFGLLATFFLRKTFLSWRDNSALIIDKLSEFNILITADQAKALAKAIRAPMWEWHYIFGFIFAALVVWRLIMILKSGFGEVPKERHMRVVHHSYKLIYAIFIFMALSGLFLYFREALGVPKESAHTIKELHEIVAWSIALFVPLHIIGVFIAENRDQKGIISKMVSG